ncbi:MAG: ATP-dependent DNA helicase RecQ, partial [Chitinophagales bacterium]|nr:ATP-dependent DNA helicase RecQ [Chitinophagales bacterium]
MNFYFYSVHTIHGILKQYWGFDKFRPLQEEIIHSVLDGKDTLALLPTGGGKSVCFQVPAMAMEGVCLVISPLIALMKDQVYNLQLKGIKAVAVYSGLPHRVSEALLDSCVFGQTKFLYISPERLASDDFRERMQRMKICLLAVDEAHCISQWGYDFRPQYTKIAEVREKLTKVPVIALTATATPKVVDDIQDKLLFRKKLVLQQSFVRKNLSFTVRNTENKEQQMLDILTKVKGSAVVYVRNRKRTQDYAKILNRHKLKADFYHAGLQPNERSQRQDDWINNKTRIICCTNAFGMGIDKPDVRTVIHMDLADSLEAYYQEAGRAGRDEQKAYAVQLFANNDLLDLDKNIKEGFPETAFIKDVYEWLCGYLNIAYNDGANKGFDFDLGAFADSVKQNPVKLMSALRILAQQEVLGLSDNQFQLSQVKCISPK